MKIAIDAGHGMYTSGKRCAKAVDKNETHEWVLNNRIATYVCKILQAHGVQTLRTDDVTGQVDVGLTTRCNKANNYGADYLVSIHHDSGAQCGIAGGCTVFVYNKPHNSRADTLQRNVYNSFVQYVGKFGNRANPLNQANFAMVRQPHCPAILIECGFMDSKIDTPMILTDAFARKAAKGISVGIFKTVGISYTDKTVEKAIGENAKEDDEDMDVGRFEELFKEYRKTLQDNDAGTWSKDARDWAVKTGLVQGNSADEFNGMWQDLLTREQMVVLLKRFAEMMGKA